MRQTQRPAGLELQTDQSEHNRQPQSALVKSNHGFRLLFYFGNSAFLMFSDHEAKPAASPDIVAVAVQQSCISSGDKHHSVTLKGRALPQLS